MTILGYISILETDESSDRLIAYLGMYDRLSVESDAYVLPGRSESDDRLSNGVWAAVCEVPKLLQLPSGFEQVYLVFKAGLSRKISNRNPSNVLMGRL